SVPATAELSVAAFHNPDVSFNTASPHLMGLVIRQWPTPTTGFLRDIMLLHRALPCSTCDPLAPSGGVAEGQGPKGDEASFETGTLSPGLYTLQLFGNDDETVTLHLHGLGGEVALQPTEPASQDVRT